MSSIPSSTVNGHGGKKVKTKIIRRDWEKTGRKKGKPTKKIWKREKNVRQKLWKKENKHKKLLKKEKEIEKTKRAGIMPGAAARKNGKKYTDGK